MSDERMKEEQDYLIECVQFRELELRNYNGSRTFELSPEQRGHELRLCARLYRIWNLNMKPQRPRCPICEIERDYPIGDYCCCCGIDTPTLDNTGGSGL